MDVPVNYDEIDQPTRRLVREEYARMQEGRCSHCGEPLSELPRNDIQAAYIDASLFPSRFFSWPVHLHHSHLSGMTIGAVHARCNAFLWQYHGE